MHFILSDLLADFFNPFGWGYARPSWSWLGWFACTITAHCNMLQRWPYRFEGWFTRNKYNRPITFWATNNAHFHHLVFVLALGSIYSFVKIAKWIQFQFISRCLSEGRLRELSLWVKKTCDCCRDGRLKLVVVHNRFFFSFTSHWICILWAVDG